jgi:hypothetical protein
MVHNKGIDISIIYNLNKQTKNKMKKLMLSNMLLKTAEAIEINSKLMLNNFHINMDELLKEGGLDFIKDFATINYLQIEMLEKIKKELDKLVDAEEEALYQLQKNS